MKQWAGGRRRRRNSCIAENLSPLKVRAHNALSEFYFDRQQAGEAEAEARRSVEIQPTPQGDWDLGLAEWRQGNFAGAERAFLDAKSLNPSDSRAHFMLGLFYKSENRIADAIREYRAGLQLDPSNADAVANLKKLEFGGIITPLNRRWTKRYSGLKSLTAGERSIILNAACGERSGAGI